MNIIFPVLENRNGEKNKLFVENASEILYNYVMVSNDPLINELKNKIIDIFKIDVIFI